MSKIFLKPVGGLCNRIRVIGSALQIAGDADKRLVVLWEKNPELNCAYSELFERCELFDLVEVKAYRKFAIPFFPSSKPKSFLGRQLLRRTQSKYGLQDSFFYDELNVRLEPLRPATPEKFPCVGNYDEKVHEIFAPVVERLKSPETCFISSCWQMGPSRSYRQIFRPISSIDTRVEAITSNFPQNTFGLHIRGTDSPWAKLYCSVSAFEDRIDETIQHYDDASFFLATDEPAIKDRLVARYGSRMLFLEQSSYDRNSSRNIQNALVDVLCLAATREVFGTYFSTFSRLAADWHGIQETTVFKPSTDISS